MMIFNEELYGIDNTVLYGKYRQEQRPIEIQSLVTNSFILLIFHFFVFLKKVLNFWVFNDFFGKHRKDCIIFWNYLIEIWLMQK